MDIGFYTDPVHGKVLVAPLSYRQAILKGGGILSVAPIAGPLSEEEKRMADLMYTERYRPWCVTEQIAYMRKLEGKL